MSKNVFGEESRLDLDRVNRDQTWLSGRAALPGGAATSGTPAIGEGPGIDLVIAGASITVGLGGDTILLYDSAGAPVAEYAATDAGLTAALAAATAGDTVELPSVTISGGPWTVALGTLRGIERFESVLDGLLIVDDGARAEHLSVVRSEDEAAAVVGIQLGDEAYAVDCYIAVTNATGNVYGVYAIGELDAYAVGNQFDLSAGGDAYGAFADGAELWVSHGGFVPGTTYIPVGVA